MKRFIFVCKYQTRADADNDKHTSINHCYRRFNSTGQSSMIKNKKPALRRVRQKRMFFDGKVHILFQISDKGDPATTNTQALITLIESLIAQAQEA